MILLLDLLPLAMKMLPVYIKKVTITTSKPLKKSYVNTPNQTFWLMVSWNKALLNRPDLLSHDQ